MKELDFLPLGWAIVIGNECDGRIMGLRAKLVTPAGKASISFQVPDDADAFKELAQRMIGQMQHDGRTHSR